MFKTLKDLIVQIKKNKKKDPKISYTATLIKGKNNFTKLKMLAAYAISRGYESEIVWDILKEKFEK